MREIKNYKSKYIISFNDKFNKLKQNEEDIEFKFNLNNFIINDINNSWLNFICEIFNINNQTFYFSDFNKFKEFL